MTRGVESRLPVTGRIMAARGTSAAACSPTSSGGGASVTAGATAATSDTLAQRLGCGTEG
eukprot:7382208-Prymnesium_polylepis.1